MSDRADNVHGGPARRADEELVGGGRGGGTVTFPAGWGAAAEEVSLQEASSHVAPLDSNTPTAILTHCRTKASSVAAEALIL